MVLSEINKYKHESTILFTLIKQVKQIVKTKH